MDGIRTPIQKNQFILDENYSDPFVRWCVENRTNAIETFRFSKDDAMKLYLILFILCYNILCNFVSLVIHGHLSEKAG